MTTLLQQVLPTEGTVGLDGFDALPRSHATETDLSLNGYKSYE